MAGIPLLVQSFYFLLVGWAVGEDLRCAVDQPASHVRVCDESKLLHCTIKAKKAVVTCKNEGTDGDCWPSKPSNDLS